RQQPVEDQHDNGRARPDTAQQRYGQQKAEHRQAGNRLDDVRDRNDRRGEPWASCRHNAKRHADEYRDEGGKGDEQDVLTEQGGQLEAVRRPEGNERAHALGMTGTASSSRRTRVSVDRASANGSSHATSRPPSITPIRSARAKASPMSWVTMTTVF